MLLICCHCIYRCISNNNKDVTIMCVLCFTQVSGGHNGQPKPH